MKLSVLFPTCEIGNDPVAIRDFAQAAEDLGFSKIVAFDHVLGTPHDHRTPPLAGPYTERDPFHEAIVLLSFIAGATTNIELMTGVLVLPQRQTALLAKQCAELSILSGGRFTLGVGTGWNHVEFGALDVEFESRGDRMTEQVDVLRQLWREPLVEFTGRFHHIDRAALNPRPQEPIPIWFGGASRVALQRAARIGDGYLSGAPGHRHVEELLEMLRDEGRSTSDFELCEFISFGAGPDVWEAERDEWHQLGGTEMCLSTQAPGSAIRGAAPLGFDTPHGHLAALERFMQHLSDDGVGR
jgi:probable F420-dependent oxidoreductase